MIYKIDHYSNCIFQETLLVSAECPEEAEKKLDKTIKKHLYPEGTTHAFEIECLGYVVTTNIKFIALQLV